MRGKNLLDKMDLVDPSFVEAAEKTPQNKKRIFAKYGALAACLALIIGAVGIPVFYNRGINPENGQNVKGEDLSGDVLHSSGEIEKQSNELSLKNQDDSCSETQNNDLPGAVDEQSGVVLNCNPASAEDQAYNAAGELAAPDYEKQLHRSDDVIWAKS